MGNFPELAVLATAMGLSIFLSMPIILRKSYGSRTITLLNAVAIGILLFLTADLFANASGAIYTSGANAGYIADPARAGVFVAGVAVGFLGLFALEHRSRGTAGRPSLTALMIALAIGFQNLTEGLVFGAGWAAGAVGLVAVIFVGFFVQNVTEGFPITAPFLGGVRPEPGRLSVYFLIGGIPTTLGALVGYFYNNAVVDLLFQSLAIGSILYCVLPMLRTSFRPADPPQTTYWKQRLVTLGILAGFLIGFATNAI